MLSVKNGTVLAGGSEMDYIRFGSGPKVLILLPGLGDGLQTVKGTALPMAFLYRSFARVYTVYAFSRPRLLAPGCTTRDMARMQKEAMDCLGIHRADILGVSMGGMVAQHLAADYPEAVNKLVLAVTCPCPNPLLEESVKEWITLAQQGDHTALMDSNIKRIYSDAYYRKNKWLVPIMGKVTRPRSYDRFLTQAQACLTHDCLAGLSRISCPTLVIGGEQDQALGPEASRQLASAIPGAALKFYPQWGHGLYEEAADFQETVLSFLK